MTDIKTKTQDVNVMKDIARLRVLRRKQRIEHLKTIIIVMFITGGAAFAGGYHMGGQAANTTLNAVQSAYKSK